MPSRHPGNRHVNRPAVAHQRVFAAGRQGKSNLATRVKAHRVFARHVSAVPHLANFIKFQGEGKGGHGLSVSESENQSEVMHVRW